MQKLVFVLQLREDTSQGLAMRRISSGEGSSGRR